MSDSTTATLILVGIPSALCFVAGALHGLRRGVTRRQIAVGAFFASALTCWSIAAGGGDMPMAFLLPSWFVSPMTALTGMKGSLQPPWWLTPWLPFALYVLAAFLSHPRNHDQEKNAPPKRG